MGLKRRLGALAVALTLSLFMPSALAVDTVLNVRGPTGAVSAGETFDVTVEIAGNPGVCSVQFTLVFDRDAMTCTRVTAGSVLNGMMIATNEAADAGAIVAAASAAPVTGDGVLATLSFRARSDISDGSFQLADISISGEGEGEIAFTLSGATLTTVPKESTLPASVPSAPTAGGMATAPQKNAETPPKNEPVKQDETAKVTPNTESGAKTQTSTAQFSDTAGHWGASWIEQAQLRGLINGYGDGTFRPDANMSRGDYVLILWRAAGEPEPRAAAPFDDVTADAYYQKAVAWACENGYVNGKGNGFAPTDSLTRQEAMKILFGWAGGTSGTETMLTAAYDVAFSDSGSIAAWARPAMYWAYYNGVIGGMSATTLGPEAPATRAQLAKILVGYLDKLAS